MSSEASPAGPAQPVRMPLSVGSTSLLSGALAAVFFGLATALAVAVLLLALQPRSDLALVGLVGCAGAALGCALVAAVQARNALTTRPSDLVLDQSGVRVSGGPLHGFSMPWAELAPPGAVVEESGAGSEPVWHFALTHGTAGALHLAVVTDPGDARSVKAARASVEAVVTGRRALEDRPAVARETLACPACGAGVAPGDEDAVPCAHCGAAVPIAAPLRELVRAAMALDASRDLARDRVRRLHAQPDARAVERALGVALGVAALGFLATWGTLAWSALQSPSWRPLFTFFLLAPFALVGLLAALARVALANRAALRVLALAYGALAPERPGEPQRCRRCHGPLRTATPGALERCVYCEADNVMGLDVAGAARASAEGDEALEVTLAQLGHERRRWVGVALGVLALTALWGWFSAGWAP